MNTNLKIDVMKEKVLTNCDILFRMMEIPNEEETQRFDNENIDSNRMETEGLVNLEIKESLPYMETELNGD